MNINSLTTAQRETLILEVLNMMRTHIPNVTKPSSILINQNQPVGIEQKGVIYNVTAYLRAVDYAGQYLFLGPFYLKGKFKDGLWEVSEPRFDPQIDGCYYDVVGMNGSHLKFYDNMITINEVPVNIRECTEAVLRGDGEGPSKVIYVRRDGTTAEFNWNNSTQNLAFMQNLIRISNLMIDLAGKEREKEEAVQARAESRAAANPVRPGFKMPPVNSARPGASLRPEAAPRPEPAARPAARPAAPAPELNPNSPFARRQRAAAEAAAVESGASAPAQSVFKRPNITSPMEQAASAPHAAPAEGPAIAQAFTAKSDPDSPFLPDTRVKRPEKEVKPAFVPLQNVTPEMEKPKPFDGPSILDTYVPEWTEDTPAVDPDEEKAIGPMTAASLANIDARKHVRSVVSSPEEEVEKYRRLLAIGAITPDEFEIRKNQLLNKTKKSSGTGENGENGGNGNGGF
ncbi:hypothetical protein SAMN02910456_02536 [Ruminococcaceae bacterium YRB3002]|nr:hypothetical protein SAMN02910456_02536 [Ruminococcaceae bacterium YRB3002]